MKHSGWVAALLLVFCQFALSAQAGGKRAIEIRGRTQDVYYYPAASRPPRGKILFAPGTYNVTDTITLNGNLGKIEGVK